MHSSWNICLIITAFNLLFLARFFTTPSPYLLMCSSGSGKTLSGLIWRFGGFPFMWLLWDFLVSFDLLWQPWFHHLTAQTINTAIYCLSFSFSKPHRVENFVKPKAIQTYISHLFMKHTIFKSWLSPSFSLQIFVVNVVVCFAQSLQLLPVRGLVQYKLLCYC